MKTLNDEKKLVANILFYVENNLDIKDNYSEAICEIEKLNRCFLPLKDSLTIDLYIMILTNKKMLALINVIMKNDIVRIQNELLSQIYANEYLSSLIEAYCIINNIHYNNETNLLKKETTDILYENSVRIYLNEIGNIPLLNYQTTAVLFQRYYDGDEKAREMIIEGNLRLVVAIAKKYASQSIDILDLIGEGNIGLMKAVDRFNPKLGYHFSTYATWWIRHHITRFIENTSRNVRIPAHYYQKISRYQKARDDLEKELGREPTNRELALYMELSSSDFAKIYALQEDTLSLNAPIKDNIELGGVVSDDTDLEEKVIMKPMAKDLWKALNSSNLTKKEMYVLERIFGLNCVPQKTLKEIGDDLGGISKERVRQIKDEAFCKICSIDNMKCLSGYMDNPEKALENSSIYVKDKIVSIKNHMTIYEYFKEYSKEEVDLVISELSSEDKFKLEKYKISTTWTKSERSQFKYLTNKMRKMLEKNASVGETSQKRKVLKREK